MNKVRVARELVEIARILNGERMLSAEEVGEICPACAEKMKEAEIAILSETSVREEMEDFSVREAVAGLRQAEKWETLPDGWTKESLHKYWDTMTGDVKHKITRCMKDMEGKIDDPGAFCGGLASKVGYR